MKCCKVENIPPWYSICTAKMLEGDVKYRVWAISSGTPGAHRPCELRSVPWAPHPSHDLDMLYNVTTIDGGGVHGLCWTAPVLITKCNAATSICTCINSHTHFHTPIHRHLMCTLRSRVTNLLTGWLHSMRW